MPDSITLSAIQRYPVKGLNAEALTSVELSPGRSFPLDRRYAIALGSTRFDGPTPHWLPRRQFAVLAATERLAMLEAEFDANEHRLTLGRRGRTVCSGRLGEPDGRRVLEDFLSAFLGPAARGKVRIVEMPEDSDTDSFADTPGPFLSLINRASVCDIGRVNGAEMDPRRFRGNLLIDGAAAWAEFGWIGKRGRIGAVELEVVERIERCVATNVNPDTAERDLNIPRDLMKGFGHADCGVLVKVLTGGTVRAGDAIEITG